jgi:hypothetical protein
MAPEMPQVQRVWLVGPSEWLPRGEFLVTLDADGVLRLAHRANGWLGYGPAVVGEEVER